uniref:THAP-type domain-containing protein n=1 Tax=Xiphophorus couchianus TaxID=32473 RepID=A0A3B5LP33_9TELE
MPSRCIAAFCSNTREDGVSLFRFPKEPELLSKWVREVRRTRELWKPSPTSVLCSEHFELHCFDFVPVLKESLGYSVQHKRVLLPTAVPTVFPSGRLYKMVFIRLLAPIKNFNKYYIYYLIKLFSV